LWFEFWPRFHRYAVYFARERVYYEKQSFKLLSADADYDSAWSDVFTTLSHSPEFTCTARARCDQMKQIGKRLAVGLRDKTAYIERYLLGWSQSVGALSLSFCGSLSAGMRAF